MGTSPKAAEWGRGGAGVGTWSRLALAHGFSACATQPPELGFLRWALPPPRSTLAVSQARELRRCQGSSSDPLPPLTAPNSPIPEWSFHTLSCIFNITLALFHNPSWWLVYTTGLINVCFPFISPFLLMSRDSIISSLCFLYMKNSVSPNLIRKM